MKQIAYSISKINVNQNHKYYNNKLNKQQLRETIHTNQLKQKQWERINDIHPGQGMKHYKKEREKKKEMLS